MWSIPFVIRRSKTSLERVPWRNIMSAAPLEIENALVLSKVTRYEVEKHCNPELNESQLERMIRSRGTDFDSLIEHHQRHKDYERYVLDTFKKQGVKTKLLTRLNYDESWVESCNAVFPVGGDGTFLLAASKVRHNNIPVIGFNSDPHHSEGFLCLPQVYSHRVDDVLTQLKQGSFKWLFRARIRVTLTSKEPESPKEPSNKKILGSHRTKISLGEKQMSTCVYPSTPTPPSFALNEVFVGESLSAQVSYFEMQVGGGESTKVKSSGLCISTGTGSTSWHLSINRLTSTGVAQILKCAGLPTTDSQTIANKYNNALLFDPEELKMCYTIRDLITAGVWPSPPGLAPRGFASTIWIRSRCRDARLVVDGGSSFTFNDGAEAFFHLCAEDALRTVVL